MTFKKTRLGKNTMKSEGKVCQNCKNQFVIEPEDFSFYGKIKVPPPTFCPECRLQRRMAWRNERTLYKRRCDAPGHSEEIISMYAADTPFKAYDMKFWWSDEWDPMDGGMDYDFAKPFFAKFRELLRRVPHLALSQYNSVQSDYSNFIDGNKNTYLIFGSGLCENVFYATKTIECKDSMDTLTVNKSELLYECVNCTESYKLFYSRSCKACTDSYFLYGCRSCSNCFGCTNLVSKSYCFLNQQYSKEEYFAKVNVLKLGHYSVIQELKKKFHDDAYLNSIHRYANTVGSVKVTGDNVNTSKNCQYCFDIYRDAEDSKFLFHAFDVKDAYDALGQYKNNFSCENVDNDVGNMNVGTITVYASNNVRYSFNCHNSNNLFGCIGLRKKSYCILNRQYSKEEYEALVPRIIEHMNTMPFTDKKGRIYRFGEFFPIELGSFAYNETIAQEYFPLTKEKVLEERYTWKDTEAKQYAVTAKPEGLPNGISEASDEILKEVIGCAHRGECNEQCTTAFKFIPQELAFYRKMNIPLPRLCSNCRHYARLKQRNPLKLWHRKCQCAGTTSENGVYANTISHVHGAGHCPNEFETLGSTSKCNTPA